MLNARDVHTVVQRAEYLTDAGLVYACETYVADQNCWIQPYYLGNANRRLTFFRGGIQPRSEQAGRAMLALQVRCQNHVKVIEDGGCLVLLYNCPRNVHWMVVIAWKDGPDGAPVYHVQPRNSMRSLRHHDGACVADGIRFLDQLYEYNGTAACDRPTWRTEQTPDNISEQAAGEYACGLHAAAQLILASRGMWLTHAFDEGDIDILRLRLTDAMIGDGLSILVQRDRDDVTNQSRIGIFRDMRVRQRYWEQIKSLRKTVEGRVAYGSFLKWQRGDVIRFHCIESGECVEMQIVSTCVYTNLRHMLQSETVGACLPHLCVTEVEAGVQEYRSMLTRDDLQRYGVIAIRFRNGSLSSLI